MTDSTNPPVAHKWLRCHGQQFRKLAQAGMLWLEQHSQHVNELNVFPVPDGDTGTNMLLTMRAAYNRIQHSTDLHVGNVARELAHGALMGARGNSGVILSQILRGLARELREQDTFDAARLARAIREGADTAYNGVMKPVEGTILTVVRESAEEAADAARKSQDLRFVMERVLERSQQALERTPELLPVLRQAGVVDAGGQGLVYIFEGMLRYVSGEIDLESEAVGRATAVAQAPAQALAAPEGGLLENPYDVQFILMGDGLDVLAVRRHIDAMGDSTVVVGDEQTIKVHIHVKDPGQPLSYGASLGRVTDVVVENMQLQMESIIHAGSPPVAAAVPPDAVGFQAAPPALVQPGQIGVVAVAAGQGLGEIFRSLGVACVVNGGQTNNPSTEEIYHAVQEVPTDRVIILPNNKNIILAAEAACELSGKEVAVVPTRTAPQGISAMLCLHPDGELAEAVAAMETAAAQVATGEITQATRSVTLDGVTVTEGEIIGMVDGRLYASGPDIDTVLPAILEGMELADREILSLYYGADIAPDTADQLAAQIQQQFPDIEVEVLAGGQPYYFYILGAE